MPCTLVTLISRKEGMTLAEFKEHMESRFVPLMKEVCGPLHPVTWTRRYIAHTANDEQRKEGPLGLPAFLIGHDQDIGWDSFSEMTFQDELHLQQYFALINEEEPAEKLLAEEAKFSDTQKLKFILMEAWRDDGSLVSKRD
jgi:hypothetical protein